MCLHALLCLAVCAALTVEAWRWVAGAGQAGVERGGRQRAGEEVLIRAEKVSLGRGGTGQAEILVGGASPSTGDPGAGGRLVPSQLPDLKTDFYVRLDWLYPLCRYQ